MLLFVCAGPRAPVHAVVLASLGCRLFGESGLPEAEFGMPHVYAALSDTSATRARHRRFSRNRFLALTANLLFVVQPLAYLFRQFAHHDPNTLNLLSASCPLANPVATNGPHSSNWARQTTAWFVIVADFGECLELLPNSPLTAKRILNRQPTSPKRKPLAPVPFLCHVIDRAPIRRQLVARTPTITGRRQKIFHLIKDSFAAYRQPHPHLPGLSGSPCAAQSEVQQKTTCGAKLRFAGYLVDTSRMVRDQDFEPIADEFPPLSLQRLTGDLRSNRFGLRQNEFSDDAFAKTIDKHFAVAAHLEASPIIRCY